MVQKKTFTLNKRKQINMNKSNTVIMKAKKWTMSLAAIGVAILTSTVQAEQNKTLTAMSSTVISGSVEASYNGSFGSGNKLGENGFAANGASLTISSPLGSDDYSASFNVELLLGQRAADFSGEGGDFHIKNANINLNLPYGNGVNLTVGLFDTILGYEVEASGSNPNVNRSYGYDLEPFTHTGLLASSSLTDNISVSLGVANAFDSTSGLHNEDTSDLALLGGISATAPDSLGFLSGSTVYAGYTQGAGEKEDTLFYVGASIASPIKGVSFGVAYDNRGYATPSGDTLVDAGDTNNEADAVALYAVWDTTDSTSLGLRYDTLDGTDGDSTSMCTVTLSYSVWENVLTRLELNNETGDRVNGSSNGFGLNLFYQF